MAIENVTEGHGLPVFGFLLRFANKKLGFQRWNKFGNLK